MHHTDISMTVIVSIFTLMQSVTYAYPYVKLYPTSSTCLNFLREYDTSWEHCMRSNSQRFSSTSEVKASELLENLWEIFPRYFYLCEHMAIITPQESVYETTLHVSVY